MVRGLWAIGLFVALSHAAMMERELPQSLQALRDNAQRALTEEMAHASLPQSLCPNMCLNHGTCEGNPPKCVCRPGYAGEDCSIEKAECFAEEDCPHRQRCVKGSCQCKDGFWGSACSQECENQCSENGLCIEGECFCDEDFSGSDCSIKSSPIVSPPTPTKHGVVMDIWLPWQQPKARFATSFWPKLQTVIATATHKGSSDITLVRTVPQSVHEAMRRPGLLLTISIDSQPDEQSNIVRTITAEVARASRDSQLDDVTNIQIGDTPGFASLSGLLLKGIKAQQDLISIRHAESTDTCQFNCSMHGECISGVCVCDEGYFGTYCYTQNECEAGCAEPMICDSTKQGCVCPEGFSGDLCDLRVCVPADCNGHGTCHNGTCECEAPWEGAKCEIENMCPNRNCSGHGACTAKTVDDLPKKVCVCDKDYHGNDCHAYLPCIRDCSGNGLCDRGTCVCDQGFKGNDCSVEFHCPHDCSGHGNCVLGICHCDSGFTSYDCSRVIPTCPNGCSGVGTCVDSVCHCPRQFTGEDCSVSVPFDAPCLHNCSGHGNCSHGVCECAVGYAGQDCSALDLPCPNSCSGAGICNLGVCKCSPGYTGEDCSLAITPSAPNPCAHNCGGHGICTLGSCVCSSGYTGVDCSRSVQLCPNSCSGKGRCLSSGCDCEAGFSGESCQFPKLSTYNCPRNCSGHGVCDGSVCRCYSNYLGVDCSVEASCPNNCSGHGLCIDGECVCKLGYGGSSRCGEGDGDRIDCSQVVHVCPSNCSGHGACSDNGLCICDPGFTGEDCSTGSECPYHCSGHGLCQPSGSCLCDHGFTGAACDTPLPGCATPCPANSRCNDSVCVCLSGWKGADCSEEDIETKTCPSFRKNVICSGHGVCSKGVCHCNQGRFGSDCSQTCPNNCSSTPCELRGLCVEGTCHCLNGFTGTNCSSSAMVQLHVGTSMMSTLNSPLAPLQILIQDNTPHADETTPEKEQNASVPVPRVQTSEATPAVISAPAAAPLVSVPSTPALIPQIPPTPPSIPFSIPSARSEVIAKSTEVRARAAEAPAHPHHQPACPKDCSGNGECVKGRCQCRVESGFGGPDCSQILKLCPNSCSGAGWCNFTTGECECSRGFSGVDCSTGFLQVCDRNCTGSGICEDGRCNCNRATSGKHCEVHCPNGCSGNGVCVHGACVCASHFHGDSCAEFHPTPNSVPQPHTPRHIPHVDPVMMKADLEPADEFTRILEDALKSQASGKSDDKFTEMMLQMDEDVRAFSGAVNEPDNAIPDSVYEKMLQEALHITV